MYPVPLWSPLVVHSPGGGAELVEVTPISGLDLAQFDCEGGEFNVSWTGDVDVAGTITIGLGTTVRIVGSAANPSASSGGNTAEASSANEIASASVNMASLQPGPVFFVKGGELFLEGLAVRGGSANNSVDLVGDDPSSSADIVVSGGGLHAVDAIVTVTRCEFEDNFAQRLGAGIFANRSTLVVDTSVFRRCSAGDVPSPGDEDVLGAGGGIGVRWTLYCLCFCPKLTRLRISCHTRRQGAHSFEAGVSRANDWERAKGRVAPLPFAIPLPRSAEKNTSLIRKVVLLQRKHITVLLNSESLRTGSFS